MNDQGHVSFFVPNLRIGGAQRVTVTLANALQERGYRVDLIVARSGGALTDDVQDAVRVIELDPPKTRALGIATSIPGLTSYLVEERPSVMFSQMTYGSLVATAARLLGRSETALFGVEHSEYRTRTSPRIRLVTTMMKYAYRSTNGVIAVSNGVAESIRNATTLDLSNVRVINNPVDVDAVRDAGQTTTPHPWLAMDDLDVVLAVGRFDPRKDYETLIRAFALVHDRKPATRLIVLGAGPTKEKVHDLVDERALTDVVALPGSVSNPYAYMTRASLLALTSRTEGLPTVLIEALSCGCPIVSTDCSTGPREILAHGEYGHLVPVGESDAVADAICTTLDGAVDAAKLRQRAEYFGVDRAVAEYESVIDTVC